MNLLTINLTDHLMLPTLASPPAVSPQPTLPHNPPRRPPTTPHRPRRPRRPRHKRLPPRHATQIRRPEHIAKRGLMTPPYVPPFLGRGIPHRPRVRKDIDADPALRPLPRRRPRRIRTRLRRAVPISDTALSGGRLVVHASYRRDLRRCLVVVVGVISGGGGCQSRVLRPDGGY